MIDARSGPMTGSDTSGFAQNTNLSAQTPRLYRNPVSASDRKLLRDRKLNDTSVGPGGYRRMTAASSKNSSTTWPLTNPASNPASPRPDSSSAPPTDVP